MEKKILILFLGILLIGFVSAADWINWTDAFVCTTIDADCNFYGMASNITNINQNPTDFWFADPGNDFVYHLKRSGTSWINQTDGFKVTVNNPGMTAVNGIAKDGNNFWLLDDNRDFMFNVDSTGVNVTLGFSVLTAGGLTAAYGFWRNGSDFWVIDNTIDAVFHFDKNGNNMTDGFRISQFGIEAGFSLTTNITSGTPTDFWIPDYTDLAVYHVGKNSTGGWENKSDGFRIDIASPGNNIKGILMYNNYGRNNIWITASSSQTYHVLKNESICQETLLSGTPVTFQGTNNETFNYSSYETKTDTFIINLTSDGGQPVTAELIYGGVNYGGTKRGNETNMSFITTVEHSLSDDIYNSFYWNISYGTASYGYLSCNPQEVYKLNFGICTVLRNIPYLNISFRNESDNKWMRAELSSGTFYIRSGDNESLNRTVSYSSSTENISVDFCMNRNPTLAVDETVQASATDFPQRILKKILTLTNTVTNQLIYLLSTSDGIYVTFQVLNGNTLESISNVEVVGVRDIGGTTTTVAQGTTDAAGSVTFWLNPDYSHTFNFSAVGYDVFTTNIYPTQSSYSITLGGTTSSSIMNDYTQGITIATKPSGSFLANDTTYNFNLTIGSTYWDVESFGFTLFWNNGTIAGQTSAATNGGTVSVNANTYNLSGMRIEYFYVVNSTYQNGTRTWYIEGGGTKFSILNFFNDLSLYMSAGIFGIDSFGRILLSIFIIVITIGTISTRYGIQSEAAIMGILFGIVYFFDMGIGLIPDVVFGMNAIPHFVTIVTGLLMIAFLIREEMK